MACFKAHSHPLQGGKLHTHSPDSKASTTQKSLLAPKEQDCGGVEAVFIHSAEQGSKSSASVANCQYMAANWPHTPPAV